MVNKKGFIKIAEASVAIILVLAALVIISLRSEKTQEEDFSLKLYPILDEIGKNESLRQKILLNSENIENEINSLVKNRIRQGQISSDVKICELNESCSLSQNLTEREVFAAERIIGASLNAQNFSPKKIKIFLWRD